MANEIQIIVYRFLNKRDKFTWQIKYAGILRHSWVINIIRRGKESFSADECNSHHRNTKVCPEAEAHKGNNGYPWYISSFELIYHSLSSGNKIRILLAVQVVPFLYDKVPFRSLYPYDKHLQVCHRPNLKCWNICRYIRAH